MKTIEVIVMPDGATRVETRGFVGSLPDASRFVEQSLGAKHDERMTTEYYQPGRSRSTSYRANVAHLSEWFADSGPLLVHFQSFSLNSRKEIPMTLSVRLNES